MLLPEVLPQEGKAPIRGHTEDILHGARLRLLWTTIDHFLKNAGVFPTRRTGKREHAGLLPTWEKVECACLIHSLGGTYAGKRCLCANALVGIYCNIDPCTSARRLCACGPESLSCRALLITISYIYSIYTSRTNFVCHST